MKQKVKSSPKFNLLYPTSESVTTTRVHKFNLFYSPPPPWASESKKTEREKVLHDGTSNNSQPAEIQADGQENGKRALCSSLVEELLQIFHYLENWPRIERTETPDQRDVNGQAGYCMPAKVALVEPPAAKEAPTGGHSHHTPIAIMRRTGHLRRGSVSRAIIFFHTPFNNQFKDL